MPCPTPSQRRTPRSRIPVCTPGRSSSPASLSTRMDHPCVICHAHYRIKAPIKPVSNRTDRRRYGLLRVIEKTRTPWAKPGSKSKEKGTVIDRWNMGAARLPTQSGIWSRLSATRGTVTVQLENAKSATSYLWVRHSIRAERSGRSHGALGRESQWVNHHRHRHQTGKPCALHSRRAREYYRRTAHHAQINTNFFEDDGADV